MATIILEKPETGATEKVEITDNVTDIELAFDIYEAGMEKVKDGFKFSFENGSAIILKNFYTVYNLDFAPNFMIHGYSITSEDFFSMDSSLLPGSPEALYNHGITPTLKIEKLQPSTKKVVKVDENTNYIEIQNDFPHKFSKEKDDFILHYEDSTSIRLENFYKVYNADFLPSFVLDGKVIPFDEVFRFVVPKLAPKGFFPPDIEAKIHGENSSLFYNHEKYKNFADIKYSASIKHISHHNEIIIQNNAVPSPTITFAMLFALTTKIISNMGKC